MFEQMPTPRRRVRVAFMIGAIAGSVAAGYLWWYFGDTGPVAHSTDRGEAFGILAMLLAFPTSLVTGFVSEFVPEDRFGTVLMIMLMIGGIPLNWGLICGGAVAIISSWTRAMANQTNPPST
ncbi:hypothetical protein [Longimicrobium sp.]|jgi:hypothetical protein|uniref:hypothetical protein n=1 Tax=Longimicrobium sp. TaxID=2029185 RepID=UPI002ED9D8F8